MSSEIKLEDDITPIHRPLYKMSPQELQEAGLWSLYYPLCDQSSACSIAESVQ